MRTSFARQSFMSTIGAELTRVEAGAVEIVLPFRADLTQQNGTLHAGVIAALADSACGYAALSLMPEDSNVVSVEFKLNLLEPASADRFAARARVVRSGRTLTVTTCDVVAGETIVATMLGTMIRR